MTFTAPKLIALVSQQLLDELTENGERDLTQLRLDDIEREVYGLVDAITDKLLQGVVEDQAIQADVCDCPRCSTTLDDRPAEERQIQLKRNTISWMQPVKHCSKCRCDFFPSVTDAGNSGGGHRQHQR